MMRKVRMLVWEECRTGGSIAAVCLAVSVAMCFTAWLEVFVESTYWYKFDRLVSFATASTSTALALLLLLRRNSAGHMVGGFPERILRLPATVWLGVAAALAARSLLVFSVAVVPGWLTLWLFAHGSPWTQAVLITEFYLVCQLFDWLRRPIRGASSIALLVLSSVAAITAIKGLGIWEFTVVSRLMEWFARPVGLATVFAGVYLLSVAAVGATRRGVQAGVPEIWEWPRNLTLPAAGSVPRFSTPLAAQVWYEHRRVSRHLPVAALLIWLAVCVAVITTSRSIDIPADTLQALVTSHGLYAAFALACVVCGLRGALGRGTRTVPYLSPVATADLARARMKANARMFFPLLAAIGALAAGTCLLESHAAVYRVLTDVWTAREATAREIIWYFVAPPIVLGIVGWAVLAITTRTMGILSVLAIAVGGAVFLRHVQAWSVDTGWAWRSFPFVVVGGALWAWGLAWRRKLVHGRAVARAAAVWGLLALLAYPSDEPVSVYRLADVLSLGALGVLPFAAWVIDLKRRRHTACLSERSIAEPSPSRGTRAAWPLAYAAALLLALWLKWPAEPAYVAAWHAKGEPATLEELDAWYPHVPDAENLAVRLAPVMEALNVYSAAAQREIAAEAQASSEDLALVLSGTDEDYFAKPVDEKVWKITSTHHTKCTEKIVPLMLAALDAGSSSCRWPVDLRDGISAEFSYLAPLRTLAGELRTHAFYRTMEGCPEEACTALLATFPLADSLRLEPILISQLVRVAILRGTAKTLRDMLNRTQLTDADLIRLDAALRDAIPEGPGAVMRRALAGERVLFVGLLEQYEFRFPNDLRTPPESWTDIPARAEVQLLMPTTLDRLLLIHEYRKGIEQDAAPAMWPESWRSFRDEGSEVSYFRVPKAEIAMLGISRVMLAGWQLQAQLDLARAAVAVERYRLKNGQLPASLDDLAPEFLDSVPKDPFGPGNVQYNIESDGAYVISHASIPLNEDNTFRVAPVAVREAARRIVPVG